MPDDFLVDGKAQIPTNLRLLYLLEHIAQSGVPVHPSALSDALNLPRATVHRLLVTAETEGFLQRHVDGRSYGPGRRMRLLAINTVSSQRIRTERLLVMKSLAEDVGETCNLAVPARYGMVYLDRVETHWPLRIQLPVGTQVPFHCTASGKMYLSSLRKDKLDRLLGSLKLSANTSRSLTDPGNLRRELGKTRQQEFSTDDEEFMEGMAAIAVPICDDRNRLLTTLSIHAPVQRHRIEGLKAYLPRLKVAADKLREIALD